MEQIINEAGHGTQEFFEITEILGKIDKLFPDKKNVETNTQMVERELKLIVSNEEEDRIKFKCSHCGKDKEAYKPQRCGCCEKYVCITCNEFHSTEVKECPGLEDEETG